MKLNIDYVKHLYVVGDAMAVPFECKNASRMKLTVKKTNMISLDRLVTSYYSRGVYIENLPTEEKVLGAGTKRFY